MKAGNPIFTVISKVLLYSGSVKGSRSAASSSDDTVDYQERGRLTKKWVKGKENSESTLAFVFAEAHVFSQFRLSERRAGSRWASQ